MADYAIRECGGRWMYCTGECKECIDSRILATNSTNPPSKGHGHWEIFYVCSNCGETTRMVAAECPCCHTKMTGLDIL